jgi:hypothetical protein
VTQVLCAWLSGEGRIRALGELRTRVFHDQRAWIPAIAFRDPDSRVEEVFQLYEKLGPEVEGGPGRIGLQRQTERAAAEARLVVLLLALRTDRTVRTELEPVFRDWLKRPGLSVQQCLLSLL